MFGFVVVAGGDLLDEALEVGAVEGHRAVHQSVQQHAQGPKNKKKGCILSYRVVQCLH